MIELFGVRVYSEPWDRLSNVRCYSYDFRPRGITMICEVCGAVPRVLPGDWLDGAGHYFHYVPLSY